MYNTLMVNEVEYKVEYEVDKETGYITATIPELNYVSSFGGTFQEAEAMIKEAATGYLEVLLSEKKEIPKPKISEEGTYLKFTIPKLA